MTSSRLNDADYADNTMAMTAIDLSNSTSLSENIILRNVLQKDVGEFKAQSQGLSVAQLCAQKH